MISHFLTLINQIVNIYTWTFVYNIVRVYSCKSSNVNKVDNSTLNPVAAIETDPENNSKSSTGSPVTAEDFSGTVDHENQLEIERTSPDRRAKVILSSNYMDTFCVLFCIACIICLVWTL